MQVCTLPRTLCLLLCVIFFPPSLQDCCLIPESPFYLEGKGGLLEFIERRLKENGHMVIVVAEGAGQDLIAKSMQSMDHQDASGNKLLLDVGHWLSQKIKVGFSFKCILKYTEMNPHSRWLPCLVFSESCHASKNTDISVSGSLFKP